MHELISENLSWIFPWCLYRKTIPASHFGLYFNPSRNQSRYNLSYRKAPQTNYQLCSDNDYLSKLCLIWKT